MSQTTPKTKHRNLEQNAYTGLLRMIITMEVKPGEYLDERKLAGTLGIGRTPVRAAIARLKLENFLEGQPNKSTYVKELSIGSVKDLLEAMMITDKNAMFLAAQRVKHSQIRALEETQEAYQKAVKVSDIWKIISINIDFHDIIYNSAGNAYLARFHHMLRNQAERISFMAASFTTPGELTSLEEYYQNVSEQHLEMIDSLRKHDRIRAEKLAASHNALFKERVLSYLRDTQAV